MSAPKLDFEQNAVRDRLYRHYRSNQYSLIRAEELKKRAPYLRRLIKSHFPSDKNARILDLGCGTGTLLTLLQEASYRNCWGVDTSTEQVMKAQAMGVSMVTQGDLFAFLKVCKEQSYDVILTFDLIEHLTKVELFNLADEVYRTLSRGGSWIIHTANAEGPFGNRVRYSDLTHEQAFTRESMVQLASAAGFASCECFEDTPVVHGLKSLIRWGLWKPARSVVWLYMLLETGGTGGRAVLTQNLIAVARK